MRIAFSGAIVLALAVLGAGRGPDVAQELKVLEILEIKDAASLSQPKRFNPVLTCNAALSLDAESPDRTWIKASFDMPDEESAQSFSAVFFETHYASVLPP